MSEFSIWSEVKRMVESNDRLRARVAELEAAGDRFAVAAEHVSSDINSKHEFLSEILDDEIHRWRVVRGERGEGSE